jgi:hypothetical protein
VTINVVIFPVPTNNVRKERVCESCSSLQANVSLSEIKLDEIKRQCRFERDVNELCGRQAFGIKRTWDGKCSKDEQLTVWK